MNDKKPFSMGAYFLKLRQNDLFRVGLGDIRLTMGMQKEIVEEFNELANENYKLHCLLDLRDEAYFKFCETGIIETENE